MQGEPRFVVSNGDDAAAMGHGVLVRNRRVAIEVYRVDQSEIPQQLVKNLHGGSEGKKGVRGGGSEGKDGVKGQGRKGRREKREKGEGTEEGDKREVRRGGRERSKVGVKTVTQR